jgi:hypothetical protein
MHPHPAKPGRAPQVPAPLSAPVLLVFLLAGCADLQIARSPPPAPPAPVAPQPAPPVPQERPREAQLYAWDGDGRTVSQIWIDVDEQRARFYEGSEQIGWTTIASGLRTHPTPTGSFEVLEKLTKKRSNLYGKIYDANGRVVNSDAKLGRDPIPPGGRFVGASMPYFMRLTYDGVAMHAGPIPRPGHRASHGCIRMPRKMAPIVFAHVPIGTPVTITGDGPRRGPSGPKEEEQQGERYAAR